MKEHLIRYRDNKKAVMGIVCDGCIVRATCEDYCKDIDYLILMCADVRYHEDPKARTEELITVAKSIKGVE
jgi:hypothetical protein